MSQSGILYERLELLQRSRGGHLASITRVCNERDESLKDFSNVVRVRTLQTQVNTAWEQYCACCDKYDNLLDTACEKYQSVLSDCAPQRSRVQVYNALLAEQEISELNYEQEGIKWSPELEVHGRENQLQPLQIPIVSLPSVITSSLILASAPMANPPLTSTPAADDPATTDRVHTNRGVCFSEPPKAPKTRLKAGVGRDVSKLAEAHCHNQIQSRPLISLTSTISTVTPGVSNTNVSNANMNESLAAIMSSMERISASHDLPHVRVQKFNGSPQDYPAFRQRFKQLVETKPLDDAVKMTRLLQFLEGPALIAVQRHEPLPGELARNLRHWRTVSVSHSRWSEHLWSLSQRDLTVP
ncbi:uncharacterized protein LOC141870281 [Acropora palmata]|uniref:uncharacterized protein LOC141870281 n=1 Tax=Acropora palmata TaxID=6131 RepID=UPI003DA0C9FB